MKFLTTLLALLAWLALTGPGTAVSAYTNPVFTEGQDPKLAFRDGWYYYVKWSHSGNINHIYRSQTLEDLGPHRVLPAGIPLNVPVHIESLNGHALNKWFIFGPGVWECDGDPYDGNWTLTQPDIFNQTQFRLDYYTFLYKGELFLAWAGNEQLGTTGWWFESVFVSRVLYNGSSFSLETPVASTANMIATYSFGPGSGPRFNTSDVVVEAPAVYSPAQFGIAGRDDELFMLLAIDGAHTNYYSVGMIVFTGTTPAEIGSPSKWQKVILGGSERLFSSHNPNQSPTSLAAKGLKGPGVVALAPAPNGNGLWMYYHSKHNDNFNRQSSQVPYDWIRRVMLQEIGWSTHNGRLIPDFFAKPIIGVGESMVPGQEPLSYNFDAGTLDGWTDLTTPNTNNGPRHWALSPPAFPGDFRNGSGAVGQAISGGNQDSSHPTLWLRSPEFSFNGSGELTAWLKGGAGANLSLAGTAAANLPATSTSPGFQGIALRNATTGQYVLSARKNSSGDDWQMVTFTAAQLAALDQNARYTLDLIDQGHGGWGWVAMDSVTIPGTLDVANTAPTITAIADQSIAANTDTGPLAFTLGDAESDPALLTLGASSSNPTLVPSANIVFGGSGANRSVTVTPAANQIGTATITLTVSDGEMGTDESFTLTVLSGATPITFGFDDGTLQGWTLAATDSQGRQFFALVPPSVSSPHTVPHAGTHFIGLHIPAFGGSPFYFQDSAHDTLVLRSPEFTLNGAGDLSAWLCGGGTGSPSLAGTAVSALPAATSSGGFRGIALRNATTGQFALSASKSSDGNTWQQVGMTAAQLAALPQNHVYTLDFIDAAHGGWAWVNMDSVTIPGNQVAPPNPYLDWSATKGLSGPAAAFDADPDGDGIANGLEFVLGGQPNPALADANSQHLLPTGALDGEHLVFTYRRSHAAAYLGALVEFASDLSGPWITAVDGVNATITAALIPGAGADMVTVAIPAAGLPRLFARLRVEQPAP
jgi:hypothetical protein